MEKPTFVYTIYIGATREKIWNALTDPEFIKKYWGGAVMRSDWAVGSDWSIVVPDGRVFDTGKVVAFDPPSRLVVTWRHEIHPELTAIGYTRATFDLEQAGETVKLTVTHEAPENGEPFIAAVSKGWPHILSALKTLMETGAVLPGADKWPEGV